MPSSVSRAIQPWVSANVPRWMPGQRVAQRHGDFARLAVGDGELAVGVLDVRHRV